ncbi:kynureninase [Sporobolomyces salmoneus]|uniref:kynureninase n=1 Tax=Sporobolomyces salmoneus TaxID=183962 RepID=UPI00316D92E1
MEATTFSQRIEDLLAASGATSASSPAFAEFLDKQDQLAQYRQQFSLPNRKAVRTDDYTGQSEETGDELGGRDAVYLAGNSLGLMPKTTPELIQQELSVWAATGVIGHVNHPHGRPWIRIDETVTPILAELVGAKPSEVACMGSLTGNLHTLFTSFYRPTPTRHKIMFEGKAFPSDCYAFASHVKLNDYSPSSLLPVYPRPNEYSIRTEDILKLIEEEGDSIAVICFGAVQYYNGEWFDMEAITKAGHAKGCIVGFDCAHAAGNVPLQLHDLGVDFACWCSYKYLNSGPGGIAGLYVHERWEDRKRLAGWWGHSKETRFDMPTEYSPLPGAAGWQFSNPSVIDVVSLLASLQIFEQTKDVAHPEGGSKTHLLSKLRQKSTNLTGYLEFLLQSSQFYIPPSEFPSSSASDRLAFTIITPSEPSRRGCQLSLLFAPESSMQPIFDRLRNRGILGDERKPGVIRFGPTPLYNTFEDVRETAQSLEEVMRELESENK